MNYEHFFYPITRGWVHYFEKTLNGELYQWATESSGPNPPEDEVRKHHKIAERAFQRTEARLNA